MQRAAATRGSRCDPAARARHTLGGEDIKDHGNLHGAWRRCSRGYMCLRVVMGRSHAPPELVDLLASHWAALSLPRCACSRPFSHCRLNAPKPAPAPALPPLRGLPSHVEPTLVLAAAPRLLGTAQML